MSDSDDTSDSDYDETLGATLLLDDTDDDDDEFHVIISGAGIGGLLLANLLEAAGISYEIIERRREMKAYGKFSSRRRVSCRCRERSVLCLQPNVLPVFEQLGLYDEIKKISYPVSTVDVVSGSNMKKISDYNLKDDKECFGYQRLILQRPLLHNLLLRNIPPKKIHFGKKFKMLDQRQEGVAIQCTDKSEFYGDILVGADGCFIATLPGNKIGWHATIQLTKAEFEEGRFRNSDEWEYEANDRTLQKVADISTPFGKLGKLSEATPRELISRAFLGDILLETWNYQRTVLIGDGQWKD
ncbi:hypothetical protein BGZ72_008858 [Mortierella alpina]|nr:hypothetical protein BGZ72_008858 [Mortierella alpina]